MSTFVSYYLLLHWSGILNENELHCLLLCKCKHQLNLEFLTLHKKKCSGTSFTRCPQINPIQNPIRMWLSDQPSSGWDGDVSFVLFSSVGHGHRVFVYCGCSASYSSGYNCLSWIAPFNPKNALILVKTNKQRPSKPSRGEVRRRHIVRLVWLLFFLTDEIFSHDFRFH